MKKSVNVFRVGNTAKTILAIMLLLSLTLSMVGCGDGGDTSSDVLPDNSGVSDVVSGDDLGNDTGNESDVTNPSDSSDTDSTSPSSGSSDKAQSNKTSSNKTQSQNPVGVTVVNNCYTSGRKIAKDKVTFKVMIGDGSSGTLNFNKTDFVSYVEKEFNIKLDFELVSYTAVVEKVTAALASNKMPDLFMGMPGGYNTFSAYIDNGKFVEIGQYLDTYGPNIKKMFKEQPETVYASTHDDGKTYMLPAYGVASNYSARFFINKTWLANLGLKVPTTTQEFKTVLQAFLNNDPNKNGKKDEIPLTMPLADNGLGNIANSLFSPFGVYAYNDGYCIDQKTGKVTHLYVTNEYRNGLRYYKDLLDSGLLSENYKTTTYAQIKNGTSGTVQTIGAFVAPDFALFQMISQESFMKNYILMPALTDSASRKGAWINSNYDSIYPDWFLITKNCKYPEVAVRLADWMYSTEGSFAALVGTPGEDKAWNIDSKGNYVAKSGKKATTPGYNLPHYWSKAVYSAETSVIKKADALTALNTQSKSMYDSLTKVKFMPHLIPNKKERKAIADANAGNPTSTGSLYTLRFMSGTKSLDNDWNSYLAELDRLGMNKLIAIKQSQYDRYNVYMKKAGK